MHFFAFWYPKIRRKRSCRSVSTYSYSYLCVLAFWYLRSSKTNIIHVSRNVFFLPHLEYFLWILVFIFVRISKTLKILDFRQKACKSILNKERKLDFKNRVFWVFMKKMHPTWGKIQKKKWILSVFDYLHTCFGTYVPKH